MAEPDAGPTVEQVGLLGGHERVGRDAETLCGAQEQRRIAGGIARRQQQQPPGLSRQGVQLPPEAVLDPARQ
jgi:hypothetical protein